MYTKWVKGAKALLSLPTVIVDVTADGERDPYEFLIEFTCKNETPLIEATELRFSARSSSISDEQFESMKATAIQVGIDEDLVNSVKLVDHSKCKEDDEDTDRAIDKFNDWVNDQTSQFQDWMDQKNDQITHWIHFLV